MSDACDYRQMGNQINAIQEKLEAGLESNNPMVVQKTQQALRDLERAYEGVVEMS